MHNLVSPVQVSIEIAADRWPLRLFPGGTNIAQSERLAEESLYIGAFRAGEVIITLECANFLAVIAGSNLLSTAVKFPAARSATAWAAWEANGPGDVGEVPALLLQAVRKHATASVPVLPPSAREAATAQPTGR